jgi:hypothetical protein
MTVDSTATSRHDQPATDPRGSAIVRVMQVVLGLLAVAVFGLIATLLARART